MTAKFRQVDVTRALRAAKAAGMAISRCEIDPQGKIVLVSLVANVATTQDEADAAFDKWEREHGEANEERRRVPNE